MLSKVRHWILLVLIALLPLHAFFVTVGTKLILGPGHPPLVYLAIWKEVLIVFFFLVAAFELLQKRKRPKLDLPTGLVLALLILSLLIPFVTRYEFETLSYVFGFKYLFLPLLLFVVCKSLSWDTDFLEKKVFHVLFFVGWFVVTLGTISLFLPLPFFTGLGYSAGHSLYSPDAPLSVFQYIAGTTIPRMQSTFAGPNQLGLWLLIPWSITAVRLFRGQERKQNVLLLLFFGGALFLTFSRAAWIAAFIILIVSFVLLLKGAVRKYAVAATFATALFAVIVLALLTPQIFLRGISNQHHLARLEEGFFTMLKEPLGHGLGAAGPASNKVSDACVYFSDGADTSWARARKDLCVFVGKEQVQPPLPSEILEVREGELRPASQPSSSARKCKCAFLPENWYLQVGIELGILGFLLFITLILVTLEQLLVRGKKATPSSLRVFLVFLGVSIASLFLHGWEDSAVAYSIWSMAGIALTKREKKAAWFKDMICQLCCKKS